MNDMSLIETPIGILEIHTVKDYLCKVQFMSETNQNREIIAEKISYSKIPNIIASLSPLKLRIFNSQLSLSLLPIEYPSSNNSLLF